MPLATSEIRTVQLITNKVVQSEQVIQNVQQPGGGNEQKFYAEPPTLQINMYGNAKGIIKTSDSSQFPKSQCF